MKILLIMPWDPRHRRFRSFLSPLLAYPPLTLPLLAALVPEDLHAEITVFDEMVDRQIPFGHFDVVGITCMTAEAPRAYYLAEIFKKRGAFVVLGGYHPTLLPDEALLHADAIVMGEAEAAWPQLLRDFAAGAPKRLYASDEYPAENIPAAKREFINHRKYSPIMTIMATRGCHNRCDFCAISRLSACRSRDVGAVIDEIHSQKRKTVIFYDPHFFANRDYALELMRRMEPLKLHWGACALTSIHQDDELLRAAKRSGCAGLLIGLESFNGEALAGVHKSFNDPAAYRAAIAKIQSFGISVTGTFVLGMDSDTEADLLALPDRVCDLGINCAIFFIQTPAPGTPLFERLEQENRILTYDWSRYTQADVVFNPKNISPERLMAIHDTVWRETYRLKNIIRRVQSLKTLSVWERAVVFCMNIGFKFIGKDL